MKIYNSHQLGNKMITSGSQNSTGSLDHSGILAVKQTGNRKGIRLNPNRPDGAGASTVMAVDMRNNYTGSLVLETVGVEDILSLGINVNQVGTRTVSKPGGIFRFDTRTSGATPKFSILTVSGSISSATEAFVIRLNDQNTYLGQSAGLVGVGYAPTTTLTEKFQVQGNVSASLFKGPLTGTASYASRALTASYSMNGGGGGAVSSYTNSTDNRVITSTGGTGINGESNLTFDGSALRATGSVNISGSLFIRPHPSSGPDPGVNIIKVKPLQQNQNNVDFNFMLGTFESDGARNNDTFGLGWNLGQGGTPEVAGRSMLALSFESRYDPPAAGEYQEFHLLHTGLDGVAKRPITFFLSETETGSWSGAIQTSIFDVRLPAGTDNHKMFRVRPGTNDETQLYVQMLAPAPQQGIEISCIPGGNYAQLAPYGGMTSPTFYLSNWTQVNLPQVSLGTAIDLAGETTQILARAPGSNIIGRITTGSGITLASGVLKVNPTTISGSFTSLSSSFSTRITDLETSGPGGGVNVSGTPSNNQIATFTDADTITGESNLTFDGSKLTVVGPVAVTGSLFVSGSQLTYGKNLDVDSGATRTIVSISTGSYRAAFFDYIIAKTTNSRAGTLMCNWNGASIQYAENSTTDIGNTNEVSLTASLGPGGVVQFQATTNTNDWSIKTLVRMV